MSFTDFLEVTTDNPGTTEKYGSNDTKELMQVYNGKTVPNRRPKIANPWIWLNYFDMSPPGGAPTAPTESNVSRFYVDPSDFKLKIVKTGGTIVDLENVNIPNSALTAITDKAKLPATTVYTDQTNTFGTFNQIFRQTRLHIRNIGNTFAYIFAASASDITADRTVSFPLLTGDDQFTFDSHATTLLSKTINATNNTITDTSIAQGDLLKAGGSSKFVRMGKGTSLQVLRTNSGATDLEWASLDSERVGKSTASASGSTAVFNIAHGLGSTPTYAFISVAQSGSAFIGWQYTVDSTNIVVTFASNPASGTNNVIIYWRVVA